MSEDPETEYAIMGATLDSRGGQVRGSKIMLCGSCGRGTWVAPTGQAFFEAHRGHCKIICLACVPWEDVTHITTAPGMAEELREHLLLRRRN